MIGYLALDKAVRLVLEDDNSWSCDEAPIFADVANAVFGADDYSPADGEPGFRQISMASGWFGKPAVYTKQVPELPPGAIP